MERKLGTTYSRNESALAGVCPFAHALGVLGRRWRPALIWKMSLGLRHYGQLRRALPGITEKMLTKELAALVALGLVTKVTELGDPRRTAYGLSCAGRALLPALAALQDWGDADLAHGFPKQSVPAARA